MPSSLVDAGLTWWQASEEREAQEDAQKRAERAQKEAQQKQLAAQQKAAREAAARTPAQLKQRDYSTDATNTRLRGIQATMLASRKAQGANAGGKTKLGE